MNSNWIAVATQTANNYMIHWLYETSYIVFWRNASVNVEQSVFSNWVVMCVY